MADKDHKDKNVYNFSKPTPNNFSTNNNTNTYKPITHKPETKFSLSSANNSSNTNLGFGGLASGY